jgi:periplasmic nitrate reductase NapD
MMNSEWHVSGLVVQARPESFPQLVTALLAIADTEIPAQDQQNGKLVVVMQSGKISNALLEKIESARNLARCAGGVAGLSPAG